jgi:hypothetical protein
METFYTLIPIFILWEILSLIGLHEKFASDLDFISKNPGKPTISLMFGLTGIAFGIIQIGYIIWSTMGLFTPYMWLFLTLNMLFIPSKFLKDNDKYQKIWAFMDSVISIIILITIWIVI